MPGTPLAVKALGPVGPVPAGLAEFYGQPLSWGGCADFATDAISKVLYNGKDLQCATMDVPLDYAKPDGREISIGLLRKQATSAKDRIGALVINPGGPGQSGMAAAASLAGESWDDPLSVRFDLVGFDPRGIGSSEPAVKCLSDAEKDADRLEPPITGPDAVAKTERESKEFADKCTANTGADVLANVGTRDVAKDMDVLRSALGEQKMNYLGFSYGTRIGTAYAEAFPANVRAMVLDGAVDPNADRVASAIGQANGFKKAFDAFAAACVEKGEECPLGTDGGQAEAKMVALLEPLKTTPLNALRGRKLSYSDAVTAVAQGLYSEELWTLLEQGITGLAQSDGSMLNQLADLYLGRGPDGRYSNIHDAFTAVHCADDPPVKDRAVVEEQARRIRDGVPKSPLNDDEDFVAALDECAFWPVPSTSQPHEPKTPGLPKVLVVSSTGDPATPYESGVKLAKALNASLLTVEANSHTAFLGDSRCVNDAGAAYLVDLKLPAEGTKCG